MLLPPMPKRTLRRTLPALALGLIWPRARLCELELRRQCVPQPRGRVSGGAGPSSWRKIEVDGALLAFRDDSAEATVARQRSLRQGRGRRAVAIAHAPPVSSLHRPRRHQPEAVRLDGREALRTELVPQLDGVAKRYTIYVLKKDGCVYDFMRIAAPDALGSAEHGFERFVAGFATWRHHEPR